MDRKNKTNFNNNMAKPRAAPSLFGKHADTGFIGLLYSCMDSPLSIWEKQERGGEIRRVYDQDKSYSLELYTDFYPQCTYITTPREPFTSLGVKLPYLVFTLKTLLRNTTISLLVKDSLGIRRRFQISNANKTTRLKGNIAYIPMRLTRQWDWNILELNLAELTNKCFGTIYHETMRVQIHSNCRIRMIYFTNTLMDIDVAVDKMKSILSKIKSDIQNFPNETLLKSYLLVASPDEIPIIIPSFERTYFGEQAKKTKGELDHIRTLSGKDKAKDAEQHTDITDKIEQALEETNKNEPASVTGETDKVAGKEMLQAKENIAKLKLDKGNALVSSTSLPAAKIIVELSNQMKRSRSEVNVKVEE